MKRHDKRVERIAEVTRRGSLASITAGAAGQRFDRWEVSREAWTDRRCRLRRIGSAACLTCLYMMLGYNVSVPPHVRQGLFSRAFDNDDLLPRIRTPVLITHGAKDAVVKPEVVDQHKAGLAHAQIHIMPNVGHAAFWEDSAAFNQRLRAFVEMCSGVTTATRAIV
jgi:pimeloyl-ACP methyl ester carboxylesterase